MSGEEERRVQVHYHYHYYPKEEEERGERGRRLRENQKMSKSDVFSGWGQQRQTTNQSQNNEQSHREYLKGRQRSFSKLRISNCWSTDNPTTSKTLQQKPDESPYVSAFTVKEEQMSISQESPTYDKHRRNTSIATLASNSYENGVIAEYEEKLRWYKSEVERLRNIEEECVYLRQQCLMHFQGCSKQGEE